MNNPLLDHGYLELPSSTESTFILADLKPSRSQTTLPMNDNQNHEFMLADAQREIDQYKEQIKQLKESMKDGNSIEKNHSEESNPSNVKEQLARSLLRVQSLTEQNEQLRLQNTSLFEELKNSKTNSENSDKPMKDGEMEKRIAIAACQWLKKSVSELERMDGVENGLHKEAIEIFNTTKSDLEEISTQLTAPILFSALQSIAAIMMRSFRDHDIQERTQGQNEAPIDLIPAIEYEKQREQYRGLEIRYTTLKEENSSLREALASQSLQMDEYVDSEQENSLNKSKRDPIVKQLQSEINNKKHFDKLLRNIKGHVSDGMMSRDGMKKLFDTMTQDIKTSHDMKRVLELLQTDSDKQLADELGNVEEDGEQNHEHQTTFEQIRALQESIEEHVQFSMKLKQENESLKGELEKAEQKLALREEAWIAKARELDSKFQESTKNKKSLEGILREYREMFKLVLTLSPLKQDLDDVTSTAQHPFPFLKHFQQLHSVNQASQHTLELLKAKSDELKKSIQQERVKVDAYAQQLKETQHRCKQSETENEQAQRTIKTLQSRLEELSCEHEMISEERNMLESKLQRIGEGFFRIMA